MKLSVRTAAGTLRAALTTAALTALVAAGLTLTAGTASASDSAPVSGTLLDVPHLTGPVAAKSAPNIVDPYWGPDNPDGYSRALPSTSNRWHAAPPSGSPQFGAMFITDRDFYVENTPFPWPVMHWATEADTAGSGIAPADEHGDWFAWYERSTRNVDHPMRDMGWQRLNYGVWCVNDGYKVGWNRFLDRYTCIPDRARLEVIQPGYAEAKDECVEHLSGRLGDMAAGYEPTWDGNDYLGPGACVDSYINPETDYAWDVNTYSPRPGTLDFGGARYCAPWESSALTSEFYEECRYLWYSWANDDRHPDGGYFPPPGSGGGGDGVTRSITVSSTQSAAATRDATVTKTVRVKRQKVSQTVTRTVNGKRYTATGSSNVIIAMTRTASSTASVTAEVTKQATKSCTRDTAAEADACAQKLAEAAARQAATDGAADAAEKRALAQARSDAGDKAVAEATQAARSAAVPKKLVDQAKARARKQANAKINAMIG